jgi:hypothetical protein
MTVKNLHGTTWKNCKCGSWLAHWKKFSRSSVSTCTASDCQKKVEVGAHVIKHNSTDSKHYIVPLCSACNKRADTFNVDAVLISANVSETCGD